MSERKPFDFTRAVAAYAIAAILLTLIVRFVIVPRYPGLAGSGRMPQASVRGEAPR